MDYLRSYFFKNEPLISCPFFSSKLDSQSKKCLSNVLISGESDFDERNEQLIRGSFLKK